MRLFVRRALIAAGALVGLVLLLAAIDLLRIRHDLDEGQRQLTSLTFASVDQRGGLGAVAGDAAADLHRASSISEDSPWIGLLSHVPGVGAQIDALREFTGIADQLGTAARSSADDVQAAMDRASKRGPAGRVELLDAVIRNIDELHDQVATIAVRSSGFLVPPLESARSDLVRHLAKASKELTDARQTVSVLRGFLVGPRRYLVLGGNSAEMRSVGIATTSGVATIANGAVDVSPFVDSDATRLPKGQGVALPEGWDWLFGYLDPDREYGNDVTSPNFPLTGQTAAAIAERNVHGHVDGVLYLDTLALQALLGLTGPVDIEGTTYNDTNATRLLVNENYLKFTTAATDRIQRHEAQGRVAKAIFDALNSRDISLLKTASVVQVLAESRHLMAWSSLPDEETMWHDLGADGARSGNDLLVASEDLGASKLDFYVTIDVKMDVVAEGEDRRVELDITLTNPPRAQRSPIIDGGSIYAEPGEYGTYLVVYMPRVATEVVHDDPTWTSAANDGPLQATTFTARVPMGTSRSFHVSFVVPSTMETLNIVPAARINPTTWTYHGSHFDDIFTKEIDLRQLPVDSGLYGLWLVAGLLLFGVGVGIAGDARGRPREGELAIVRARMDAVLGWSLVGGGVAIVATQIAALMLR